MSDLGDNRLAVLAADIRAAHAGVLVAAKTAAERAIDAGRALLEAQALVKHGQWLPWLQQHCDLAERTAQLYMKIAELGLPAETVADMGLKAAAKVIGAIHDPYYDMWHGCDDEAKRQWLLFIIFGIHPDHVEWLRQRPFATVDEWLGEEGAKYRRAIGFRDPNPAFMRAWAMFQQEHKDRSLAAIEADVKSAPVADLPMSRRKRGGRA